MYCKHCGMDIADDSKYCNYCGKSQEEMSSIAVSVKRRSWKLLKINKTAIADGIIVIAKEVRMWIFVFAVLYAIWFVLDYGLKFSDSTVGIIILTPIVLIILWRYVFAIIKFCVKWVNTYKSKK